MEKHIVKAIDVVKNGGIIIFPTDTAFGIGCRIDNKQAVKRLFRIRRRPNDKATPVLVDTVKMAQDYLRPIPQAVVDQLIEPYWPGALTLILCCIKEKVPSLVRGGGETLGVRIPNHAIVRAIIRGTGVAILGPSANFHGEKTPYTYEDLNPELVALVDYVIPGECSIKQPSTVIDCSAKPWKVLREGAVEIQKSKVKDQKYKAKIKDNVTICIDTSNNKEIIVYLLSNGKKSRIKQEIGLRKAQAVLPLIDQILEENELKLSDITNIEVSTGPGSYTGLRVGISVANALSFTLHVPVNGKGPSEIVQPTYE